EPAACLARRPVEKVTWRVPKVPLSIVAVLCWVPRVCSVMWKMCSFGRGYDLGGASRRPVFDRSPRDGRGSEGHYRGPVLPGSPHSFEAVPISGCCTEGRHPAALR